MIGLFVQACWKRFWDLDVRERYYLKPLWHLVNSEALDRLEMYIYSVGTLVFFAAFFYKAW